MLSRAFCRRTPSSSSNTRTCSQTSTFRIRTAGARSRSASARSSRCARRSKQLEAKLREVIQFGEDNDAIGEKVHRLTLALLGARDFASTAHALYFHLREDFAVPHVVLRAWRERWRHRRGGARPRQRRHARVCRTLAGPYCPRTRDARLADLFGEAAPQLKSFSYIPLRARRRSACSRWRAKTPQRFYPEMGTVYLKRIGDMVAAALSRHLEGD